MLWADKVAEWRKNEVTLAFFAEVERDLRGIHHQLIYEDTDEGMHRLQGMCRAFLGVLKMPEDGIDNPADRELKDE